MTLMTSNDVVDEPAVHVSKHAGSKFFGDNPGVDEGSGVCATVVLIVGDYIVFHYLSELSNCVLGHQPMWSYFSVI